MLVTSIGRSFILFFSYKKQIEKIKICRSSIEDINLVQLLIESSYDVIIVFFLILLTL